MGILNYSSYVHKMEIGLRRNGMHPMAVLLLNSIVTYPSVKNRWGKPYKISRTEARGLVSWRSEYSAGNTGWSR